MPYAPDVMDNHFGGIFLLIYFTCNVYLIDFQ